MTAVACQPALDLDFVTHEIEAVNAVEYEVIGRKDELIHDNACGRQGPALDNLQAEAAVPLPFGNQELSRHRAELVGGKVETAGFLPLGVDEFRHHFLSCLEGVDAPDQVASVQHGLELQGLARVVCPLVGEQVAIDTFLVLGFVVSLIPETLGLGLA